MSNEAVNNKKKLVKKEEAINNVTPYGYKELSDGNLRDKTESIAERMAEENFVSSGDVLKNHQAELIRNVISEVVNSLQVVEGKKLIFIYIQLYIYIYSY